MHAGGDLSELDDVIFVPSIPDPVARERVFAALPLNEETSRDAAELDNEWPVTCQVKIDMSPIQAQSDDNIDIAPGWLLTSLNRHGNEKSIGGDEFYIAYTAVANKEGDDNTKIQEDSCQPPIQPYYYSAVALIEDRNDGTYWLDFCATPTSPLSPTEECGGILTIYFQYSCGIGKMAPPTKKVWANGAYTSRKYEVDLKRHKRPPIRPLCPPNSHAPKLSPVQQGPTTRVADTTSFSQQIDLSQFDLIVAFGDSTMEQLVRQRPNKKGKYFFQNNISYGEKVTFGLNTTTVSTFLDLLEQGSGNHLRNSKDYPNKAVMVGSSLWDILDSKDTLQGPHYQDHQQACRTLIHEIKQRYPNVTILWKSPTAVHIHAVDLDRLVVSKIGEAALFGIERIRYMSASRSKYLYDIQKALVYEEQQRNNHSIFFLDLYEATYLSADWLFPSDGRHYRPDLNRLMLQWFYPPAQVTAGTDNAILQIVTVKGDGKGGKLLEIPKPYFVDPTIGNDV